MQRTAQYLFIPCEMFFLDYCISMSQIKGQTSRGRFAARGFLSSLSLFSPASTTTLLTVLLSSLPPPHIPTPCTTSLQALLARSVVLQRRLPAPFSPVAPTRKLSFPTRAARASSKASTCLQTLLVLRLDQKVCSLFLALYVSIGFADVSHVGRNVIIEQSFGGPKITKGWSFSCFTFYIRDL